MMRPLLFFILFAFLLSCSEEVIWDEGTETTRVVRTVMCDTIEFMGIFDVILVQDTTEWVKITWGENLINRVLTSQKNGYLKISGYSGMNWTRSYQRPEIELHFTLLHHISIHEGISMVSAGTVKSSFLSIWDNSDMSEIDMEIDCSGFKLSVSEDNAGIFNVRGRAGYTCLEPDGSAHYRMENLMADSCHVTHKGIGDCLVNVRKVIEGEVTGRGTLAYKYYPDLQLRIKNNIGKIIPFP